MLDTFLKGLGASDAALSAMGPTIVIALALFGGFAVTQTFKWPLSRLVADAALLRYLTRWLAIGVTAIFAWELDHLSAWLCLLIGFAQPVLYWITMRAIRRYWPWLEPTLSATPSNAGVVAQAVRQSQKP